MKLTLLSPLKQSIGFAAGFALTMVPTVAAGGSPPPGTLPNTKPLESVQRLVMPEIDVSTLVAEDATQESTAKPAPTRFATNVPVSLTPANSGTWEELDDGRRLWRLRIVSEGALSMSLGLRRFQLPADAELWIHDSKGEITQGPYTAVHRNAEGGLWTALVLGDELVVELVTAADQRVELEIASVNHGYRIFGEDHRKGAKGDQGSCNIDIVCPEADPWRDQARSVARITFSNGASSFLCSAQLVNNTAEDATPYLLTAQHCIEEPSWAPSVTAYWNYQSPNCGDHSGGNLSLNQSGATFRASSPYSTGSDFTLLELDAAPPENANAFFSGWDARADLPDSSFTIHHPSGGEKSISFDEDPPTVTSYLEDESPGDGLYIRIADWDDGTTEGGSSGACLFDGSAGRCIGTLTGGFAACGNDRPDWYGRLHSQFTGEGSPQTRLSDWLDPLNSGTLVLDGRNAAGANGGETWLIPAVASNPGKGSSDWRSQISVVNSGTVSRSVSIYFVENGEAWPGTLLTGPTVVAANQSLFVDDPLLSLNPTSGLIYATVDGPDTSAFARTYNLVPDGSTFGQGQPTIPLSGSSSASELVLPMVHSAPGEFRTNVGFAQTSSGTVRFSVEIYSAAGTLLAQKDYSQASAWRQINDIFADNGLAGSDVMGGWIRVRLTSGSPAFWTTYATVIDSRTDDPTYVMPVAQ